MEGDGLITLTIKSASHSLPEDLKFDCKPTDSFKAVKQIIKEKHIYHPEAHEQRLIYSGHLLDDNQIVNEVFSTNLPPDSNQTSFTIHLVCSSKSYKKQESSSKSTVNPASAPNPVYANLAAPPMNAYQNGVPENLLGTHEAYVQQMLAYMQQFSMGNYSNANANWNQYYYQQIYGNFGNNFQQQQAAQMGNENIPRAPADDNPRVVPNNQNDAMRAARDDEDNQRDVLDWMYTLTRFALIFGVVYFYSSFTRFLIVVVLTGLVVLFQRRPQPPNLREAPVPNPPQPPRPNGQEREEGRSRRNSARSEGQRRDASRTGEEEPLNAEDKREENDESSSGVTNGNTNENTETVSPEPERPPRLPFLDVTWTFFTTFFTSLIPEMPQNN